MRSLQYWYLYESNEHVIVLKCPNASKTGRQAYKLDNLLTVHPFTQTSITLILRGWKEFERKSLDLSRERMFSDSLPKLAAANRLRVDFDK